MDELNFLPVVKPALSPLVRNSKGRACTWPLLSDLESYQFMQLFLNSVSCPEVLTL